MFYDTDFLKNDEIYLRLERTVEANEAKGYVPAYHFVICKSDDTEVGSCDLRIGHNQNLYYGGNIGYSVHGEYRGNHYAGKACVLLFELAKKHELNNLYITCNPDNIASRKSCEFVGAILEKIVDLPQDNEMYQSGDRQKCIYRIDLR